MGSERRQLTRHSTEDEEEKPAGKSKINTTAMQGQDKSIGKVFFRLQQCNCTSIYIAVGFILAFRTRWPSQPSARILFHQGQMFSHMKLGIFGVPVVYLQNMADQSLHFLVAANIILFVNQHLYLVIVLPLGGH